MSADVFLTAVDWFLAYMIFNLICMLFVARSKVFQNSMSNTKIHHPVLFAVVMSLIFPVVFAIATWSAIFCKDDDDDDDY